MSATSRSERTRATVCTFYHIYTITIATDHIWRIGRRKGIMTNETFILGLAIICTLMVTWACKTLPAESWQILAAIPIAKDAEGRWRGVNLTYYGLLTANAAIVAVALLFIFMTA